MIPKKTYTLNLTNPFFDFSSLITALVFLMIIPNNEHLMSLHIYILLSLLSVMILSSYRMISILFELVNIKPYNDPENLWHKEKYTPKKV